MKNIILLALFLIATTLTACSPETTILTSEVELSPSTSPATSSVEESSQITNTVNIQINDIPLEIDLDNPATYSVSSLSVLTDNYITLDLTQDYTIYLNDTILDDVGEQTFNITEISLDNKIELRVINNSTNNEVISYIETYPNGVSLEPIEDNTDEEGFYYFSPRGWLFKMDTDGNLVYYKSAPGAMFFNRTEVNGEIYYSYHQAVSVEEHPKLEDVAYGTVKAVIMDENFRIIDEVTHLIESDNVPKNMPLDSHQFEILGENHYLVSAYVPQKVTNFPEGVEFTESGANVVNAVVQEIKDDTLIFEWNSTDHPELYEYSVRENDYFNEDLVNSDYTHFNCARVDPSDNNLVISLKNLDAIIKVDRETSDILWILGGVADQFGLSDEQKFKKQHDVRISEDGAIMLFDNGGDDVDTDGQTRLLKIYIDEENKTLVDYTSYQVDGVFSNSMGGVYEIKEGQYVIGWGKTVDPYYIFQEIDFNTNEVLFSVGSNENGQTYKAFRYMD